MVPLLRTSKENRRRLHSKDYHARWEVYEYVHVRKFLKCLRTCNTTIAKDSLHLVADLVNDSKSMIMRDNRTACKALKSFGAMQKRHEVVFQKIDVDCYPNLVVAGDKDELAFQTKENNTQKLFLNIHGAIDKMPIPGVDKKVPSSLCALIVGALTTVT